MFILSSDDSADLAEAMRLYREWEEAKQDLARRWKRPEQERATKGMDGGA